MWKIDGTNLIAYRLKRVRAEACSDSAQEVQLLRQAAARRLLFRVARGDFRRRRRLYCRSPRETPRN